MGVSCCACPATWLELLRNAYDEGTCATFKMRECCASQTCIHAGSLAAKLSSGLQKTRTREVSGHMASGSESMHAPLPLRRRSASRRRHVQQSVRLHTAALHQNALVESRRHIERHISASGPVKKAIGRSTSSKQYAVGMRSSKGHAMLHTKSHNALVPRLQAHQVRTLLSSLWQMVMWSNVKEDVACFPLLHLQKVHARRQCSSKHHAMLHTAGDAA